jgi:hypothetical protein
MMARAEVDLSVRKCGRVRLTFKMGSDWPFNRDQEIHEPTGAPAVTRAYSSQSLQQVVSHA